MSIRTEGSVQAKCTPPGPDPTAQPPVLADSPVESLGGLASATLGGGGGRTPTNQRLALPAEFVHDWRKILSNMVTYVALCPGCASVT